MDNQFSAGINYRVDGEDYFFTYNWVGSENAYGALVIPDRGFSIKMDVFTMRNVLKFLETGDRPWERLQVWVKDIAISEDIREWFDETIKIENGVEHYFKQVIGDHLTQVTEKYSGRFLMDYIEIAAESPDTLERIFKITMDGCMSNTEDGGRVFDRDKYYRLVLM